jgi:hypothetical protein
MKNQRILIFVSIVVIITMIISIIVFSGFNVNNKDQQNNDGTTYLNHTPPVNDIDDVNKQKDNSTTNQDKTNDFDNGNSTEPIKTGEITIDGAGNFKFDPKNIRTSRPDIFKEGYFSLFDILVHLDSINKIDMDYQFSESMNTHVINSINGIGNYWYYSYYSGGWQENNAFRMDHYPYKDDTTTVLYKESGSVINSIYDVFQNEVVYRENNDGKVKIPKVKIQSPNNNLEFKNVEVTAHNLRSDQFKDGVITAIDVIMSLGDQGKITYDLKWYEEIGAAKVVKNYWVHRINKDEAYGTCGFVYEEGSYEMMYRNHIHIPSDSRVLNSPDYEEWFWICL